MCTRFGNDDNMPTQYAANTHTGVYKWLSLPRRFTNSYRVRKFQVTKKRCVDTSGRRYACTSTEKGSRKQQAEVKTTVSTGPLSSRRLRARAKTTQITCTYLQLALPSVSSSLMWSTQNISYIYKLHCGTGMSTKRCSILLIYRCSITLQSWK